MKRISLILSIVLCSIASLGQYPGKQFIGADSTNVESRGGLQGRIINKTFTDTTSANLQRVRQYPGAQIFTTSDNSFWLRNATATAWLPISGANQIDVYMIGGQSNAVGNSESPDSAIVPTPGTAFQFWNNAITAAVEPIGNSDGSAWGAFAQRYYSITGRKILFVPAAVNGSSQTVAAQIGFGNWDTTGTLYNTSLLRIDSAMSAAVAAGYSPILKGILWCQGETDADAINASTITQNVYSAAFAKMIKNYRQELGSGITFNISRTGFRVSASATGYLAVQAAQQALANPDSLTSIVYWNAYFFPQRNLMDDIYHYEQTGYNEMGRQMAEEIINSTGQSWQKQLGNVYMPINKVGIGAIVPTSPLHLFNTGTASEITVRDSLNDAVRIDIINAQNGVFSGSGIRLHNSTGLKSHIVQLSPGSALESNALWIFNNTGNVLLGSDVGFTNIYAGGTSTPNNAVIRVTPSQTVGMGLNVTPAASTLVDMSSTTRGLRVPTMTGVQMNAISSPVNGLFIYNTDSLKHCYYNGSAWTCYGSGGGAGTIGGSIDVTQVPFGSGTNTIKGEAAFTYNETNDILTIPNISMTSANTTQSTTSSALALSVNSLTTGTGHYIASSSMTSGNLINLIGTSTALAAGNEMVNIDMSGANASSSITATGMRISVTNTGTGSTNVGLAVTASGAGTNTAIAATGTISSTATIIADGNIRLNGSSSGFVVNNRANPTAAVMTIYGSDANGINFFASADVYRFKTDGELLINTTTDNGAFVLQANGNARIAGDITLPTAGNKLNITTGSNASIGTSTLVGGTVTVSTTAVTASSKIFLTVGVTGGTLGNLSIGTVTAGTSFVINSTSGTETSQVNWWIIN